MAQNSNKRKKKPAIPLDPLTEELSSGGMRTGLIDDNQPDYFAGKLRGQGIDPFGDTDYEHWATSQYDRLESAYNQVRMKYPHVTAEQFYDQVFADPRSASLFSEDAYKPKAADDDPRGFYVMSMQDAGLNPFGASPWEEYLATDGYRDVQDAYGAAKMRDPQVRQGSFMGSNAFRHP